MKIKKQVAVDKKFDVSYFRMVVPVRYDEEDIPNNFPFRKRNTWSVDIGIEEGVIEGWPKGGYLFTAFDEDGVLDEANESGVFKMDMKVVDEGSYYLLDADKHVLLQKLQGYVPSCLPEEHYGDYIQVDIELATGKIVNWPDLELFTHDVENDEGWQVVG